MTRENISSSDQPISARRSGDPLPTDATELIAGAGLAFVATVNGDGTPNLSPKGSLKVLDQHTLVFGDIASPNTIANVAERPKIEVNVVHPLTRRGYRFQGTGEVTNDEAAIACVLAGLDKDFGIRQVVVINIDRCLPVRSPRYDLYDTTEAETIRLWGDHFAGQTSEQQRLAAFADSYLNAWHSHDPAQVAALHTEDTEFISTSFGRHSVGQTELIDALTEVFQTWPDLEFEVHRTNLSPTMIVTEATAHGTQSIPISFGDVVVEPTGRPVAFAVADLFSLRDAKVAAKRTYLDPLEYINAMNGDGQ